MDGGRPKKSSAEKMRSYRTRLRGRGLRPIQLWVPDMRDPRVRARIRRQARLIAREPVDKDIEAFLDANLRDIEGWTA